MSYLERCSVAVCCVLCSLAGCGAPDEELDRVGQGSTVCGRGGTVEGIDVSSWQATINWPMVRAAGKRFAIARIGDGTYRDRYFAANWTAIRAQGMVRGAYLYFEPNTDVRTQAEIVIAAVGRLGPGDLPVTLDVEKPGPGLPSPTTYTARIQQFVDLVAAGTGRRPMIYTGRYYWQDYVRSTNFARDPLWHAQYTTAACPNIADQWHDWAFWQYTSSGRVAGIAGNVDLDRYNGTLAQLEALANVSGPPMDAGTPDSGTRPDVPVVADVITRPDVPVVTDVITRPDVPVVADVITRPDVPVVTDVGIGADTIVDDYVSPVADSGQREDTPPAGDSGGAAMGEAGIENDSAQVGDGAIETDVGGTMGSAAPPESGCGCRSGREGPAGARALAAAVVALVALRRRRCG